METESVQLHQRREGGQRLKVNVSRPAYSEEEFTSEYEILFKPKTTVKEKLQGKLKHFKGINAKEIKNFIYRIFPLLNWLPKYDVKNDMMNDFVAGFTVGIVRIPHGMAHAVLATLNPVYGLYTVCFPVFVYALLGTSRHISIGTFAVLSIMTGNAINKVFAANFPDGTPDESMERAKIAATIAFLAGVIQILMSLLHCGIVSIYLPEPLVRGFTTGAAFHVFASQFNRLFGIEVDSPPGTFSLFKAYIPMIMSLNRTNTTTLLMGLCTLVILIVVKEIQYKLKLKYPVPIELIVIILCTLISFLLKFGGKYNVIIVGTIPTGLPMPTFPDLGYVSQLLPDAFVIAIVSFSVAVSMSLIFAKKYQYEVNTNQELLAYGSSNALCSFMSCYPVTASLTRTVLQDASGGKTQIASIISTLIILLVLLVLGPLFQSLPECCLGAVILVALRGMFQQFRDIKVLWQYSKIDCAIWIVTCTAVVLLGLDFGLFTGVSFALFSVIFRTQKPTCSIMGNVPGTDLYRDSSLFADVQQLPGIKIFKMHSSFFFVNASNIKDALYTKSNLDPQRVLIERAKAEKRRKKQEKEEEIQKNKQKKSNFVRITDGNGMSHIDNGAAVHTHDKSVDIHTRPEYPVSSQDLSTKFIVLDFSSVCFMDTVGLKTLAAIASDYELIEVSVFLACCTDEVRKLMKKSDLVQSLEEDKMFVSVHDAVLHCQTQMNTRDRRNSSTSDACERASLNSRAENEVTSFPQDV